MVVTERRKGWVEKTKRQLRGPRRRPDPHQTPPPEPLQPAAWHFGDDGAASEVVAKDIAEHRHVYSDPRERKAEYTYQRLARVCLDEPRLQQGIWMCCPEEPGETWRDREPDVHPSPICLPDEHIGARQFAAEWALLWGEVAAWASLQVEPRTNAVIDADDLDFVKQLTGNLPSMIVSKWCNAILSGHGQLARRRCRASDYSEEFKHGFF